jgi:signal transduction histidine kinase
MVDASSIERLAKEMRQSGIDTTLLVDGDSAALAEAVQLSAYRVIQEALTNTLRHAGASRAEIAVHCAARRALSPCTSQPGNRLAILIAEASSPLLR